MKSAVKLQLFIIIIKIRPESFFFKQKQHQAAQSRSSRAGSQTQERYKASGQLSKNININAPNEK